MPLSICVSVFVFSSGPGWSGHSSGHQVRRQHPQGLRYVTLHHPVNADIVLLAAGLWPNQVKKAVAIFFSVFSFSLFFLSAQWVFCSCLQCFLPRGRFSHRGHFPVRLRRQAFPQSQQGVGHTAETTAAAGGREDTKGKEDWTAFMFSHIVWKHNGGCKQVWIRGRFFFFKFYNNAVTSLTPKVPQLRRRSKERRNQEGVLLFFCDYNSAHNPAATPGEGKLDRLIVFTRN